MPAKLCCLDGTEFFKRACSTSPPSPVTGRSLEACYASALRDCSEKISREHYVSESLLRYLSGANGGVAVSGLPWLHGEEKVLPPNALASKILCERHNAALSPLDDIAVRLFQSFDEIALQENSKRLVFLFNGHDLERWMLKALCGTVAVRRQTRGADVSIPKEWLEFLFGVKDFAQEQGLYVCRSIGHYFEGPHGISIRSFSKHRDGIGIIIEICGFELVLSMTGFLSRRFDDRDFAYRPLEFHTIAEGFEKSVFLSWEGGTGCGTLYLTIGQPIGSRIVTGLQLRAQELFWKNLTG
jgi:hypothetical protein